MSISYPPVSTNTDVQISQIFDDLTEQVTYYIEQVAGRDQLIADQADQIAEKDAIIADQALRLERYARLDHHFDRIEKLEAERNQAVAERDQARANDQAHMIRIANLEAAQDWTRRLFANKHISATAKLVILMYVWTISAVRVDWHSPFVVHQERLANDCGVSKDTIRRTNAWLEAHDLATISHEYATSEDGEPRTFVSVELSHLLDTPDLIRIDDAKRHGGKREKTCSKGHTVDRYAVHYCPECDKVAWYGQPGNSPDADVAKAKKATAAELEDFNRRMDALAGEIPTEGGSVTDYPELPELPPAPIAKPTGSYVAPTDDQADVLADIFTGTCGVHEVPLKIRYSPAGMEISYCPICEQ